VVTLLIQVLLAVAVVQVRLALIQVLLIGDSQVALVHLPQFQAVQLLVLVNYLVVLIILQVVEAVVLMAMVQQED
jgi:hypothetical protein